MLAKHTHAPHCTSLCPNGNTLMLGTRTLTLGHDEFETIPRASMWLDYMQINLMVMPTIFLGGRPRWTEFMRPAQIDPMGATNNVCIGPHERPRVRLPGSAGIPDASTVARRFFYYAPRHTRQLFVPKLDFCSGAGHPGMATGNAAHGHRGHEPRRARERPVGAPARDAPALSAPSAPRSRTRPASTSNGHLRSRSPHRRAPRSSICSTPPSIRAACASSKR